MDHQDSIKKIRRSSAIGLWGSVAATVLAGVFHYLPYTFWPTEASSRMMLVTGTILAVLTVSMVLLTVRKRVPQMRQAEHLTEKLQAYATYVSQIYLSVLAEVVMLCLMAALGQQDVLLMLALVSTLVLILNFPNIYKIKTDLGLTDQEMTGLFGDQYIVPDENRQGGQEEAGPDSSDETEPNA